MAELKVAKRNLAGSAVVLYRTEFRASIFKQTHPFGRLPNEGRLSPRSLRMLPHSLTGLKIT
jgi:hypothetical protein